MNFTFKENQENKHDQLNLAHVLSKKLSLNADPQMLCIENQKKIMIELASGNCWQNSDDVIWSKINSSLEAPFKMRDAKDHVEAFVKLAQGKQVPYVLDLRDLQHSIDSKVVFYLATEPKLGNLRSSLAIITNSITGWFFASQYSNYVNDLFPCRVFTQEEDAIKWLKLLV